MSLEFYHAPYFTGKVPWPASVHIPPPTPILNGDINTTPQRIPQSVFTALHSRLSPSPPTTRIRLIPRPKPLRPRSSMTACPSSESAAITLYLGETLRRPPRFVPDGPPGPGTGEEGDEVGLFGASVNFWT